MRFIEILEHFRGHLSEFEFWVSVFLDICQLHSPDKTMHDVVRSTLLRHCSWSALRANLGCLILNVKNRKFWRLFAKSDECFPCFQQSEHIKSVSFQQSEHMKYVSLAYKLMFWSGVFIQI